MIMIGDNESRVNITWSGNNGDLPDPVSSDASNAAVLQMVQEAIRTGGVPGIPADPSADLTDFVVDRFAASDVRPYALLSLRPKTPFGA